MREISGYCGRLPRNLILVHETNLPNSDLESQVHSDPETLGGIPVFVGTAYQSKLCLIIKEAGDPINEFLDHFPSVSREQAIAVQHFGWECQKLLKRGG